jgi:GAF domain-containing protein
LSGAPREAFESFGHPRATPVFSPTFKGEGTVRIDDVLADPRYGQWAPHFGMPARHLPVRSYLAVPVRLGNGEVAGGLSSATATGGSSPPGPSAWSKAWPPMLPSRSTTPGSTKG